MTITAIRAVLSHRFCIGLILALTGLLPQSSSAEPGELISFGAMQPSAKLQTDWEKLAPETRREITTFLVMKMGLSSTGKIALIGVYRDYPKEKKQAPSTLYQFQHLDLFGARLFWSVLIDADRQHAQVLYHVDPRQVSGKMIPFGKRSSPPMD